MSCVFCAIADGTLPAFRVHEDDVTLAVLDIAPATPGHTLVLPKQHTADLWTATVEQAAAVMSSAHAVARLLEDRLSPAGFNLVQSSRAAAGQDVFHLHVHVIPRYADDGLVPPWTSRPAAEGDLAAVHATIAGARP